MSLKQFIGKKQAAVLAELCLGEEGEYFQTLLREWGSKISAMPKSYETDGQGDEAVGVLHYFSGGSDWFILEKDASKCQFQAFGFCCLNGDKENAELGYISLPELFRHGVEFDLYFQARTLAEIKVKYGPHTVGD